MIVTRRGAYEIPSVYLALMFLRKKEDSYGQR
jgi:hypothetical protein